MYTSELFTKVVKNCEFQNMDFAVFLFFKINMVVNVEL